MKINFPPGYSAVFSDSEEVDDFGRSIGPIFMDEAGSRLSFWVTEKHRNVANFCHGGALAVFADTQVAVVRGTVPGLIGHTPTISLKVDYIVPIPINQLIVMQVILVRYTRSMLFTQAVLSAGGKNVGKSDGIYRWYKDAS